MPGRDRTGPLGQGSMTGRGMGFCSGNEFSGNTTGVFGRGLARGFRGGLGRRGGFSRFASFGFGQNTEDAKQNRKRAIESELDYLKKQINRLEIELEKLG
ncbi:MAG: DUF5320 domain-containing protein [Thiohalospira sp.]